MKITYDAEADTLDIRLREGRYECRTVRLSDEIALNFAEGEVLVAIEVIGASEIGLTAKRTEIVLDQLTGVTAHST